MTTGVDAKMSEKEDLVLKDLIRIVGKEWATNDPVLTAAYCFDQHLVVYEKRATKDPRHYYKSPDYVVLPGSSEEVQKVILCARAHKVPITTKTTGCNVKGNTIPTMGGILIDTKRMNKILEIDEDNMTATVEPFVTIAQLSTELQKKSMFTSPPGAPSTVGVISNYVWGMGKGRCMRIGRDFIVGFEIVLPDGTIAELNNNRAFGNAFWPYGPGPDLHQLCHAAAGSFGIVTKMTVKCWPGERPQDQTKVMWVAFDDIDPSTRFSIETFQRELVQDFQLYGGPIYSCYASDTAESQHRVNRFQPNFTAIFLLNGSERRVKYQEKMLRALAKKHGGRIIIDALPPYQSFIDGHLAMASAYFSDSTMKYWSPRANASYFFTNQSFDPAPRERFIEGFKEYIKYQMNDPDLGDLSFGHDPTFWYWNMASFEPYGHTGGMSEFHVSLHAGDPRSQEVMLRVRHGLEKAVEEKRVGVSTPIASNLTRWGLDEERTGRDTFYRKTKEFKKAIDPGCILSPGFIYVY
jgi:FAD/FMN-containing dehydrogenase